ncbi:hypothetical protein GKAS_01817 [Kluyvera ascorbata ATCC 33433]|nr:hypothetical protein GKAS_01817 [Kluyvera ascorbata ATCC 33433]
MSHRKHHYYRRIKIMKLINKIIALFSAMNISFGTFNQ